MATSRVAYRTPAVRRRIESLGEPSVVLGLFRQSGRRCDQLNMPEEQQAKARRKWPLYTMDLTPWFEVSDEMWGVVGPILFPEQTDRPPRSEIYPWLYRMDEKRREEFIDYCVELD